MGWILFFLAVCAIILIKVFWPLLPEENRNSLKKELRKLLVILMRAGWKFSQWMPRALLALWNSPDKILLFLITLPARLFTGLVFLTAFVLQLPLKFLKLFPALFKKSHHDKKEQQCLSDSISQILEEVKKELGERVEIYHLFYIAYFRYYNKIAREKTIDEAFGGYMTRGVQSLPIWMKQFITEYEKDRSLEMQPFPPHYYFRPLFVYRWFVKHQKTICTIDDFENLPLHIRMLIRGQCRERVRAIREIAQELKDLTDKIPDNISSSP